MKAIKNRKKFWELKQSTQPNTLDMYIYDYIEGDYYDWWSGQIIESETSANHFRNELAKYPNVTQINVYVNSFGGLVHEAMAIRNQLKRHPAHVTGYVDGFACSAASFILTACDEVKMYSNTEQMIHNMRCGVYGNAQELRKAAADLDAMMEGNRQAYLEKSGGKLTEEKLIELLDAETWLTAQQCLEYGLCDQIIAEEKDLTEARQMLQKVNQSLEQQISRSKAIAAQLRELAQRQEPAPVKPVEPTAQEPTPQEPEEPEAPEPQQQENKLSKMLMAIGH